MAPVGESYFPPLDRCFSGECQLLSWETTYLALSQPHGAIDNYSVRKFFSDPQTTDLLLQSLSPYSASSPESKSKFETKTSAINVTSSTHAKYDIAQIKEDTIWLSTQAKIDEISALRVSVLEWQTRARAHLRRRGSDEELLDITTTAGIGGWKSSLYDPLSSTLAKSAVGGSDPQSVHGVVGRRVRLFEIYLSERRFILKTAEYILSALLCFRSATPGASDPEHTQKNASWQDEIAGKMLSTWGLEDAIDGKDNLGVNKDAGFMKNAVHSIRSRLEALERGVQWTGLGDVQERAEIGWASNQIVEIVHIMQLMLNLLQSSTALLRAASMLPWFRLMAEVGFLENFQPPYPDAQNIYKTPLQSLSMLISLEALKISQALELLDRCSITGLPDSDPDNSTVYLLNLSAMNELNALFIHVAPLTLTSPVVLAWGIITQTLREIALAIRESRETRQSVRAADNYGGSNSSDTDGPEATSGRGISSLRRRSSNSSDTSMQSTLLEDIQDRIAITALDEDPIAYLAKNAVQGGKVFGVITAAAVEFCTPYGFEHNGLPGRKMRECLLELIRACVEYVEYQPALIVATIAVLTGSERYWQSIDQIPRFNASESAMSLLEDTTLRQNIFLLALSRFPYETLPFLQICRSLILGQGNMDNTSGIWLKLQMLDIFTCRLPATFLDYKTILEDANEDYIQLTASLLFLTVQKTQSAIGSGKNNQDLTHLTKNAANLAIGAEIPSGTQGRVLTNAKPPVVAWNHEFSALAFMGKVLQCASIAGPAVDEYDTTVSSEIVAETINLISVILSKIKIQSAGENPAASCEMAESMLGQVSDDLGRNQDIIKIIFDIFENELYKSRNAADGGESLEILIQCLHFTHSLLAFMPDRVWPFLARSGFLSIGKDGTQLNHVISSQEVVMGKYDFLIGCVRLFDALIEDAATNAVSRKAPTKAMTRFGTKPRKGIGISGYAMEKILLKYEQTMIDVCESSMNWRFTTPEDRMEINHRLYLSFRSILSYCYDVDDEPDLSKKITGVLSSASGYLVDVFSSPSKINPSIQPLVRIIFEGLTTSATSLPVHALRYRTAQTISALQFVRILIQINMARRLPVSALEQVMLSASPQLAQLYVTHESYQLPVVQLLDVLVRSAGARDQQPPSLLGRLGPDKAAQFLDVLSMLDKPLSNNDLQLAIWGLFSAAVSQRQQWLAIYLLTGRAPRESLKDKSDLKSGGTEPALNTAFDALNNLDKLEPQIALAMLEFVALAADFWPWVLAMVSEHPSFLKSISEHGARIGSLNKAGHGKNDESLNYNSLQLSSYTADILAMYARYTREIDNPRFPKMLVPHLTYLINNAITAPDYNASLQGNLSHNFALKFPSCPLAALKRTNIKRAPLGQSYYYDVELANKFLSYDSSWIGKKNDGFAAEVKKANINLSTVEAQINLFHGWRYLLLELSEPLGTEESFQNIMATAVINCLQTNIVNNLPEHIFERLASSRAELAFSLTQRLAEVKCNETEARNILPVAWAAVRACDTDLGSALEGANAEYYRILLRILYLALQINASDESNVNDELKISQNNGHEGRIWSKTADATTKTGLAVISTIVAEGFRSLTMLLHSSPHNVHPADFALLIAILRSCIRIPGLTRNSSYLFAAFADTQTARCASTLLSWSDQLAASTSGDPIYGEHSIIFLLEMSSVATLAESLAVDGVLSYILSTNLVRILQNKAFAPLDQPVRMFSIWARGILPLLLNLLYAVGSPMAAEVAAALDNFPHQLGRASSAFNLGPRTGPTQDGFSHSYITLSMVLEAQSLALIVSILGTFREAGASAAVVSQDVNDIPWDAAQVKEDVEAWLQRRSALRERIVPTNEREEALSRMKPERGDSENRLEERVVSELKGVVGILSGQE